MTPLMLIPGMMCDGRMWSDIASVVPDRMVIHAPITNADTVQELAALILADAPPVFALAGLSMGGIVAMELARQAPDRIERLALLDTNPLAEAPEVAMARVGSHRDAVVDGAGHRAIDDPRIAGVKTTGHVRGAH